MFRCDFCGHVIEDNSAEYCEECGNVFRSLDEFSKKYNLTPKQDRLFKQKMKDKNPYYLTIRSTIEEIIINSFEDEEDFKKQLNDLKNAYEFKISLINMVLSKFSESEMSEDYFKSHIEMSNKLFDGEVVILEKVLESGNLSEVIADEVERKFKILNLMVDKINTLYDEIVININADKDKKIEYFIEEMDRLIKSVRDYQ